MSFWMTQSLLSSWLYYMNADDQYVNQALSSFLSTLRREKQKKTQAMQDGIRFEQLVNDIVSGKEIDESISEKWALTAKRFAKICSGGQPQVPISGRITTAGMDFVLYGVCDYVKAGVIFDIKKTGRYEYGKYAGSPQHSMYLHLLPPATRFDYLIFDGREHYRETYRRCDCKPIEQIIAEFICFLRDNSLIFEYKQNWSMTTEREDMLYGII